MGFHKKSVNAAKTHSIMDTANNVNVCAHVETASRDQMESVTRPNRIANPKREFGEKLNDFSNVLVQSIFVADDAAPERETWKTKN